MTPDAIQTPPGQVDFVGAGPGDPELLTLRALRLLQGADVVLHDRLVPDAILALIPTHVRRVDVGKEGFGPAVAQPVICDLLVAEAMAGRKVVRLKSGDSGIFGRLDEETEALRAAGIAFAITPGITAAVAAAASLGQSLTRRGRNAGLRILTGHDVAGFADHDWRALARPGEVAAIYMGKRAAHYIAGRLAMHGAALDTPVSVVLNASRPDERVLVTVLADLPGVLDAPGCDGPAVLLYGLAPHQALAALPADLTASRQVAP